MASPFVIAALLSYVLPALSLPATSTVQSSRRDDISLAPRALETLTFASFGDSYVAGTFAFCRRLLIYLAGRPASPTTLHSTTIKMKVVDASSMRILLRCTKTTHGPTDVLSSCTSSPALDHESAVCKHKLSKWTPMRRLGR